MAAEQALSPTGYMLHHLHHNSSGEMQSIVDFSVLNYDTIVFSILLMCLVQRAEFPESSSVQLRCS